MYKAGIRKSTFVGGLAVTVFIAGCVSAPAPAPSVPVAGQCRAAPANDPLVGTWLAVRKHKGVAGELHVLFALQADGTMAYNEQLKRGKTPPRELNETGCWHHDKSTLTLQTTKSNGAPIELDDPIYSNKFTIRSQDGKTLSLLGSDGQFKARRMPDGYRLPY
ncbi:MAG TPA: hypothetical protein VIP51_16280 [Eoetvoesiella sp.]